MQRTRIQLASRFGPTCLLDGYREESDHLLPTGERQKTTQWRGTGVLTVDNGRIPFLFVTEPEYGPRELSLRDAAIAITDERGNRRRPLFVFDRDELETEIVSAIAQLLQARARVELPTIRLVPLSATRLMLRGIIGTMDVPA